MANLGWEDRSSEQMLDRLFRAYGESAAIPDASANFGPKLWEAIEARRNTRLLGFAAKLVTSGALAASLLLGVLSTSTAPRLEPEYLATYIEQTAPPASSAELLSSILEAEDRK